MKKIVSICSARPNFVKLAAVHHAIEAAGVQFEHIIVHTGQHYDPLFSDIFFEQLNIPKPAYNLGVAGGNREDVIALTQSALEEILPSIQPDLVLVYGDVNGAVGAARAAKVKGIKVGHVEAGLRSFDLDMPEEHNRIAIDQIADFLFCTEPSGMQHLEREGVPGERFLVGNTMIDTLVRMHPHIGSAELPDNLPEDYVVITLHRPSNVDDPVMLRRNIDMLKALSEHVPLVLPVHHRFRLALEKHGFLEELSESVQLLPALGYLPFLRLVTGSRFVITDSGGIQEEATFLQKRCYTVRKNTERPITIESGSNVLIDLEKPEDRERLLQAVKQSEQVAISVPDLWNGKAGETIIEILAKVL